MYSTFFFHWSDRNGAKESWLEEDNAGETQSSWLKGGGSKGVGVMSYIFNVFLSIYRWLECSEWCLGRLVEGGKC